MGADNLMMFCHKDMGRMEEVRKYIEELSERDNMEFDNAGLPRILLYEVPEVEKSDGLYYLKVMARKTDMEELLEVIHKENKDELFNGVAMIYNYEYSDYIDAYNINGEFEHIGDMLDANEVLKETAYGYNTEEIIKLFLGE